MDTKLLQDLSLCDTDIDGALRRFSNNEALYLACLTSFLQDNTICELDQAIAAQSWDDAFTAAHALKGLAGNMGFIPLFQAAGQLVVLIRSGRIAEIGPSNKQVQSCYNSIAAAIRQNCCTSA